VEYRLLGPLQILDEDRAIEVPAGKSRALLGLLLLDAPQVVSVDRLIHRLWVERPPATAPKILQGYVSRLRKALPDGGMLETRPPGYCLEVSEGQTDLGRFRRLRREADAAVAAGRLQGAVVLLREALALWRGPPLADVAADLDVGSELVGLADLALIAQEERIELELALGQDAALIGDLKAMIVAEPLRERPRGQLMVALYRSGRQAEALELYRDWRRRLADELGLEPSRELRELEQRILAHDPALGPVQRPTGPTPVPPPLQTEPEPSQSLPERERRKLVTVVCCVAASRWLHESLEPETLETRLHSCAEQLTAAIERHGGLVESVTGEMATAIFGVPTVREDDPVRALRAAHDALQRLSALGVEAQIGVAGGEILARGTDGAAIGEPLQRAARIARAAPRGAVVLAESTYRLTHRSVRTQPLEALEWRGERISVWRLLDVEAQPAARQFDSPFVGREAALKVLMDAWRRVTAHDACELVTIVADAGLGKSRLVHEFVTGLGPTRVVQGRCLSYGDGITYWPLLEVIEQLPRELAVLEPNMRAPLDVLTGGGGTTSTDEVAWAARKLLESAAADGPLVAVFDDIHWAEPPFLDLVEQAALLSAGRPLLLVCIARPELLEYRPGWAGVITLDPLDREGIDRVIGACIARSTRTLSTADRRRIAVEADGNPLFAEELTAAMLGAQPETSYPPSLHALLAARLDQLEEPERQLLEAAAVEGEVFHRSVVRALSPETRPLTSLLAALVRKDVIRLERARHVGDDGYRFRHLLLRDAAYHATTKTRRAELHARLADWIERHPERSPEPDEIIAHHLEQASRYLTELSPESDRARSLALRCAERLAAAGRHALTRADVLAAISLLERACQLDDRPARPIERDLDLAEALYSHGRLDDGKTLLTQAAARAAAGDNRGNALMVLLALTIHELATAPEGAVRRLERLGDEALRLYERTSDDAGLTQAWFALAIAAHVGARYGTRNAALHRSLAHATRCGDSVKARTVEVMIASGHLFGPTPVPDALAWLDRRPYLEHEPNVVGIRSVLEAMRGNLDEARVLCRRASARSTELGARYERGSFLAEFRVELLAGDAAAAADYGRASCARLERMGEQTVLSTQAGLLGRALCELRAYDEAAEWAQRAKRLGASEDTLTQILWRQVQSRVQGHRGDTRAAVRLADEAVRLAEETDALDAHGDALLDLAEALQLDGRPEPAHAAARRAHALYTRKGNAVMAARSGAYVMVAPID
jgi:DNA-binding SARP family transcriptional activator/class 3 adenylate cyclase